MTLRAHSTSIVGGGSHALEKGDLAPPVLRQQSVLDNAVLSPDCTLRNRARYGIDS